jgi:selenocysteine lyase/cysteine desulfurase
MGADTTLETGAAVRRYLDNAATSWPKPPEVWAAWEHAARAIGTAAGRAAYREALAADTIRDRCRQAAARLLGGVDADRVALPPGATLALNMAIHGLVAPGDHVIATAADHNATLRPLHWLAARGRIGLTIVPCDGRGIVDPGSIAAAWQPATRLVTCSHASNVTGAVQEVGAIAAHAHDRGGLLLVDAAQSLGQLPEADLSRQADIVVAPAHKWLLGMNGAAILWARPGIDLEPLVQGGTGSASDSLEMPASFVDALEAGTPDLPALAGLAAAVDWLESRSIAAVGRACRELAADLAEGLATVGGVRVIAAGLHARREHGEAATVAPIVSFTVEGYDPAEVAALLEQMAGVQVRSGFHCAASVHEWIGTRHGGTVRASIGPFNTAADIDALVAAVRLLSGT